MKNRITNLKILHLADFVPPYLSGGGGAAISTKLIIDFLSKNTEYYIFTQKFQKSTWNYNNISIVPLFERLVLSTNSINDIFKYFIVNAFTHGYKNKIKLFVRENDINMLYITSNIIPLIRTAIQTGTITFIDIRDDFLNSPIMYKRVPIEDNEYTYLFKHLIERKRIPNVLLPFSPVIVFVYWLTSKLQRKLLLNDIYKHRDTVYFVALSKYIKSRLIKFGIPPSNIHVIYNMAGNYKINTKITKKNIIVFAGIIEKAKGIFDIIDAFLILNDKKYKLIIAGDGPDINKVKKIIKEKRAINIKLIGKIKHNKLMELYSSAKIIIAPSIWPEPYGRFIQEAVFTGTPLITTKVGGIPEGIINGYNGLLVKPNNPLELSNALEQLINNNHLYKRIRNNLIKERKKYSSEVIGNNRLKLYKKYNI